MQKIKGISGSTLKIIAVISMLTDHTAAVLLSQVLLRNRGGLVFSGELTLGYLGRMLQSGFAGRVYVVYVIMRQVIGRLAFPIYCFLLVEGFQKTRDRKRYAGRLFIFALISEAPFNLAFCGKVSDFTYQNVFFTLFLGFAMICAMERVERLKAPFVCRLFGLAGVLAGFSLAAEMISCDYGAKGIAAIALLFLFRKDKVEQIIVGCAAFLWEITAPLAFIFIAFYNGQRGMKLKYVFYAFYPLHLAVLYFMVRIFFG